MLSYVDPLDSHLDSLGWQSFGPFYVNNHLDPFMLTVIWTHYFKLSGPFQQSLGPFKVGSHLSL